MPKLKNVLRQEDQLNLLISLIGLINATEEISCTEAAEQLGTTPQAIRDAIRTIAFSGSYRPGAPETPFNIDWIALEEDDLLRWITKHDFDGVVRISVRQAAAIAAGLNFFKSLPEFADSNDLDELIELLKTAQPAGTAPSVKFEYGSVNADIELLRKAILANKRVSCNYTNQRGEQSDRELDPIRLEPQGSVWYLRAWCPKNEEIRPFRVDRMRSVLITDVDRSEDALRAIENSDELEDRIYVPSDSDVDVLIEVDPEAYELVSDFARDAKPEQLENGAIRIQIKVGYLPNLGHLIARYAGAARVINPPEAREIVKNYALSALGESLAEGNKIEAE